MFGGRHGQQPVRTNPPTGCFEVFVDLSRRTRLTAIPTRAKRAATTGRHPQRHINPRMHRQQHILPLLRISTIHPRIVTRGASKQRRPSHHRQHNKCRRRTLLLQPTRQDRRITTTALHPANIPVNIPVNNIPFNNIPCSNTPLNTPPLSTATFHRLPPEGPLRVTDIAQFRTGNTVRSAQRNTVVSILSV